MIRKHTFLVKKYVIFPEHTQYIGENLKFLYLCFSHTHKKKDIDHILYAVS